MKLLNKDEPAAYTLVNADSRSNLLLVCDHASNRIPSSLGNLGLGSEQLEDHIAWDAGSAALAQGMAQALAAPLVLANYSRLVIDCNRSPDHPESIPIQSHGVIVPGNQNLSTAQRNSRRSELFQPYHDCIASILDRGNQAPTLIVSIHSFIPMLGAKLRPWSIGVCYGQDRILADLFLAELGRVLDSGVGDNQPYSIENSIDYTLPHHAGRRGLQHVMLELSRDQLRFDSSISRWTERLVTICQMLPGTTSSAVPSPAANLVREKV